MLFGWQDTAIKCGTSSTAMSRSAYVTADSYYDDPYQQEVPRRKLLQLASKRRDGMTRLAAHSGVPVALNQVVR